MRLIVEKPVYIIETNIKAEQIELLRRPGMRHILLVDEAFAAHNHDVYPCLPGR